MKSTLIYSVSVLSKIQKSLLKTAETMYVSGASLENVGEGDEDE